MVARRVTWASVVALSDVFSKSLSANKAINLMRFTTHFWFEVWRVWLVCRGTNYGGVNSQGTFMIDADNSSSLLNQLKNMSLVVPLRSDGRKTEHIERYAISHLLAAISKSDLLKYPIQVEHSDRPDFVIFSSNVSIGVEVTEAVSQNSAHADFLREKGYGPEVYFSLPSEIGERRKKSRQLKKEIEENRPGLPIMGDKS